MASKSDKTAVVYTAESAASMANLLNPAINGGMDINRQNLIVMFLEAAGRFDRELRKSGARVENPGTVEVRIVISAQVET